LINYEIIKLISTGNVVISLYILVYKKVDFMLLILHNLNEF